MASKTISRQKEAGCLLFTVVYIGLLVVMFFLTLPEPERTNFDGRVARLFTVAAFPVGHDNADRLPGVRTLEYINSAAYAGTDETFLLPEATIEFRQGDPHRVTMLEEHGSWQLVSFHYSNTRTAISTYRAYADRVEPVSFELTSHVAQGFYAIVLLLPAWVLAKLVSLNRYRRSQRDTNDR